MTEMAIFEVLTTILTKWFTGKRLINPTKKNFVDRYLNIMYNYL